MYFILLLPIAFGLQIIPNPKPLRNLTLIDKKERDVNITNPKNINNLPLLPAPTKLSNLPLLPAPTKLPKIKNPRKILTLNTVDDVKNFLDLKPNMNISFSTSNHSMKSLNPVIPVYTGEARLPSIVCNNTYPICTCNTLKKNDSRETYLSFLRKVFITKNAREALATFISEIENLMHCEDGVIALETVENDTIILTTPLQCIDTYRKYQVSGPRVPRSLESSIEIIEENELNSVDLD